MKVFVFSGSSPVTDSSPVTRLGIRPRLPGYNSPVTPRLLSSGQPYNPPRNLTSGSPGDSDPHPRSNVVIGKQSGAEDFFDRVPCSYQHCIMGGGEPDG